MARTEEPLQYSLFRDAPAFSALRSEVVPRLRTWPFPRVWHLGLSGGVGAGLDAYAAAIVLYEEGLLTRSTIYVTDADPWLVQKASLGEFASFDPERSARGYRAAGGRSTLSEYLLPHGEQFVVRGALRERMVFAQHDPASDASFNEFQLVLCAADPGAQRARSVRLVHDSLCHFGMALLLAEAEVLGRGLARHQYEVLALEGRVLRRLS